MSDPLVLDLPLPPSVNRYEPKSGNASKQVQDWHDLADGYVLHGNPRYRQKAVLGAFVVHVTWSEDHWKDDAVGGDFDADNRIKPLLDYLQRIEVIENDKKLWFLSVGWGDAPLGCRVQIRAKHVASSTERVSTDGYDGKVA